MRKAPTITMARLTTEGWRGAYSDRGFTILPAVVELATVRAAVAAIERFQQVVQTLPPERSSPHVFERDLPDHRRGGIPAAAVGDALFIIGDLGRTLPELIPLIAQPALVSLARALLETDDIRCHFANVTMKAPRVGSGIAWHRDFPNRYLCPRGSTFLRMMICLDGMDAESGATRFAVGSHRLSDDAAEGRFGKGHPSPPLEPLETAVCPAGSVVVIHPKVIHGGPPNISGRPRRNIVVQWGRADDPIRPDLSMNAETLTGLTPEAMITLCSP